MDLIDRVAIAGRDLVSVDRQRRARPVIDNQGRTTGVTIDHKSGRVDATVRPDTVRLTISFGDHGIRGDTATDLIHRLSGQAGVFAWANQYGLHLPQRRLYIINRRKP